MNTTITHSESQSKGEFKLSIQEEVVATMTYSRIDATNVIIDHTAVHPKMKGTGMGKQMVHAMVEWARENQQKVLPLCPFTKAIIDKNPKIQDILRP